MELWIRSQNKEKLVKVNELSLYDSNILKNDFVLNDKPNYSNISIIANDNYNLGSYKSKERALEVLDEIQKLIYPKNIIKYNDSPLTQGEISQLRKTFKNTPMTIIQNDRIEIEQLGSIVYEMPEE